MCYHRSQEKCLNKEEGHISCYQIFLRGQQTVSVGCGGMEVIDDLDGSLSHVMGMDAIGFVRGQMQGEE